MAISGGKYSAEVDAGRVFIGSTAAAGVALPISTGVAITFGLWNISTNKKAVPLKFGGGYTSGTIALGSLGFANQQVGYAVGTGALECQQRLHGTDLLVYPAFHARRL